MRSLLLLLITIVNAKNLFWRFDSDISNPKNWIDGQIATGCRGLHFADVNSAPVFLQEVTTAEMTLPKDGIILLQEFIEFKDNGKCIRLKPINYHDWFDPSSWRLTSTNVAIPDKHHIPCIYDNVTFPPIQHTRISISYSTPIEIRSAKFGNEIATNFDLHFLNKLTIGDVVFRDPDEIWIFLKDRYKCDDPYGCLCHPLSIPCPINQKIVEPQCENPILPEESCHEICGAFLTYKKGLKLKEVEAKLKEYSVDTYASRVKDFLGNELVQVVFSEKEFSGQSLTEAEDLFNFLQKSGTENLQFFKSGFVTQKSNVWSFVLGTLITVVMFFALLFYLYTDSSVGNLIRRFNTGRVPFFARYDTTDENLIIETQSESGSVLDLPKSFDNPMYGTTSQVEEIS